MKIKKIVLLTLLTGLIAFTGCNGKEETKKEEEANEKFDISKASQQYLKAMEEGIFYEEITTTLEGTVLSQVWIKGDKLKRVTPSQNSAMIINGEKIVSYDQVTKQGFIMQDEGDFEIEEETETNNYYDDIDQETLDAMTEEIYDGQDCMVTEMTTEGSTMKLWINKKTGFFVRFEMLTQGSLISAIEYKNVQFGEIKDSEFDVPGDIVITDMNSIMNGMEENMDLLFGGMGEGLF